MLDGKLDTLLTVYELGSFTRAAERLSLTQPAVSHQIGQIEEELGIKIFHRRRGDLKLTTEGEIAIKYARRIKALYQRMQQKIEDEKEQLTKLTVGITHTAESNLIAETLAKYCNVNTGVCITIVTEPIQILYDMLINFELDLAIVEGRVNDASVNSLLLDTDYLVCVVSPGHPLAQKNIVTIHDIKREKMILRLPSSGTRNLFLAHLESMNLSIDVVLEVDNIATIKDLIRRDFGISILARSACLDELRKGKLIALPIENFSMIRETNVLYHKDFNHPDILDGIAKLYQETVQFHK